MTDQTVAEGSEPLVATDTESAAARFQDLLSNPGVEPETGTEAAEAAPEENTDAEPEPAEAGEGEAEESVEVPQTINELAEHYGVEVNDLASHLTVKVDGEEVPLADLRDGYLRKAEFTRRMQEVAETRKTAESQRDQLNGHLAQRLQQMDTLVEALSQQIGTQVDLNRLLDEDPAEYVRAKARQDAQVQTLQQAQYMRQQAAEEQTWTQRENTQKFRRTQQAELVKALPELSDSNKAAEFEKDVGEALQQAYHFTQEEVSEFFSGAWDHRQILILRDAANYAKFREGEKKLTKKVKSLPKVQRPGSASDKRSRAADAEQDALSSMKRRGDDASAINWMKQKLG